MKFTDLFIKRPVLAWPDGGVTVGVDPAEFSRRL